MILDLLDLEGGGEGIIHLQNIKATACYKRKTCLKLNLSRLIRFAVKSVFIQQCELIYEMV